MDILFKTPEHIFSYRVGGICVHNGCVLLQKASNDKGYAFPGGHVQFGETTKQTLAREWKEEIGADVTVGELRWISEIFFTMRSLPCQQICLYYSLTLKEGQVPMEGEFFGTEIMEGRSFTLSYHWLPIAELQKYPIYPVNAVELLMTDKPGVQHFVYRE